MKRIRTVLLGAALSLLSAFAVAQPVEVSGVKFDNPIEVRGTKLELNGAGVRYKYVVKVYAAGLFLSKKASTLEEVLAAPGPKRMSIMMLRDIDSAELGKLFTRGVEDNTPKSDMSKLIPGLMRIWLGPNPADWKLKDALLGK